MLHGILPHVVAAYADAALGGLIEPRDQAHQRGFRAAGAAQNAHGGAGGNVQIDVLQIPRLPLRIIAEIHMVEADGAVGHGQALLRRSVGDLRLLVENFLHTSAAGDGAGQHHHDHGHHHQRNEDLRHIGEKGDEVAGEQAALVHIVAADPQNGHDGAAHE